MGINRIRLTHPKYTCNTCVAVSVGSSMIMVQSHAETPHQVSGTLYNLSIIIRRAYIKVFWVGLNRIQLNHPVNTCSTCVAVRVGTSKIMLQSRAETPRKVSGRSDNLSRIKKGAYINIFSCGSTWSDLPTQYILVVLVLPYVLGLAQSCCKAVRKPPAVSVVGYVTYT